jgi:hypothetical protein
MKYVKALEPDLAPGVNATWPVAAVVCLAQHKYTQRI